ncbi:T-complex protein 1 subunit alpha [Datura stramonium]|uniref:T-complex protein 1 subunit alpha n=1 Tax=Datura stramonium TaxID=4076 RepID=A0ABS8VBR5_DATST|nr:T-complex protein 1 subunit alpha [Datura stramonium]
MTKERIQKLLSAGANVILTSKGIDDMALRQAANFSCCSPCGFGALFPNAYFVEAGAIAVRRVRKDDLRHVAKATSTVSTFADMEGEETFEPSFLGHAVRLGIWIDLLLYQVSLILRGANDFMLDEMERALHDALCIVKRTLESTTVVAGGGAVGTLCVYLEYLATTLGSREQLAIAQFAESLLVIPKVLANNAAKDSSDLVSKLRSCHYLAQTKADKKHLSSMGLDLAKGTVQEITWKLE